MSPVNLPVISDATHVRTYFSQVIVSDFLPDHRFFDSDPKAAQNSTQAMYEVMVWFAQIGDSSKPYGDKTSTSRKLDGTTFNLWSGKKSDIACCSEQP
jgi:hypothetical protein